VSVVDRGEPMASCWEWFEDGTAGEYDVGSAWRPWVLARAMGEARAGCREPRWRASVGRAAGACSMLALRHDPPMDQHQRRVWSRLIERLDEYEGGDVGLGKCLESSIWQGRLVSQADLYPGVPSRSLLRARCWSCHSYTPGSQSLPNVAVGPMRGSSEAWPSRKACTYARSSSIRART
jgi:hypothetical protein